VDGIFCDRCGKSLLVDERVRYVVETRVFAAYDPLELSAGELAEDHRAEIRRLLGEIERRDPASLEDEVARVFKFDLCPLCQKDFLRETRAWFRSTPS
jgi:hypothetical protein